MDRGSGSPLMLRRRAAPPGGAGHMPRFQHLDRGRDLSVLGRTQLPQDGRRPLVACRGTGCLFLRSTWFFDLELQEMNEQESASFSPDATEVEGSLGIVCPLADPRVIAALSLVDAPRLPTKKKRGIFRLRIVSYSALPCRDGGATMASMELLRDQSGTYFIIMHREDHLHREQEGAGLQLGLFCRVFLVCYAGGGRRRRLPRNASWAFTQGRSFSTFNPPKANQASVCAGAPWSGPQFGPRLQCNFAFAENGSRLH